MNAEQALFILFPMMAVPLGLVAALAALLRRTLSPILWFNAAFAIVALPLLVWNIAAILAELESWRHDQPDLAIGLNQYPYVEALAIVVEIISFAIACVALSGRRNLSLRIASIVAFIANVGAASVPLTFWLILTIWPIRRLF